MQTIKDFISGLPEDYLGQKILQGLVFFGAIGAVVVIAYLSTKKFG